ncbi:GrpB family protein [Candidatus Bipolaricaulota bacterium]|nr:GrpB family protein [Candidatus Bipolaricaulota bacterium]TFH09533.1 MAG: GrpB family protein [Candidatus Atribacteria bacterium]
MSRRMTIAKYSEQWPLQAESEILLLRRALGGEMLDAHHIGSTAVPGLAAKPVIDILLVVQSTDRLDERDDAMKSMGYLPRREMGIVGRRYYVKGGDRRTHHVHAFAFGDSHIEAHLAFRDYLREHPSIAADYARIKCEAARRFEENPEGYVAYKHDFVERAVADALHWSRQNTRGQSDAIEEDLL